MSNEHPFEKVGRSSSYQDRMGARSDVTFEEGRLEFLLKTFKLNVPPVKRDLRKRTEERTGHPDLSFASFGELYESFPIVLGASRLKGVQLHLTASAMVPAMFKAFGATPFVAAFDDFFERTAPRADGKPVGLIFPRKGFKQGMVVYAADDPQALSLCERETIIAYVSGKKKKGQHWLIVRSYQKLLEALHNGGHGWRPEG